VTDKDILPFELSSRIAFGALLALVLLLASGQSQAQGSAAAGQSKSAVCAACHGADGNSPNPIWPSLAGQHAEYLARQIEAFKSGDREDALMTSFAGPLSAEDIADLGAYFETQTLMPKTADPALVELGEQLYRGGVADRDVPACIACHGPAGKGNPLAGYPSVGGQHATDIENTLAAYASGARRSDASSNLMMRDIAALLSEAEIQAVASYMQGLRGATN
jgi:cytochrome c553